MAAAEAFIRFLRAESAADARRHWAITIDNEVAGLIGLHPGAHDREYSLEDDLTFHDSAVYSLLATDRR